MKEIKVVIEMSVSLYQRQTLKELPINRTTVQAYDTESEEYAELCEKYKPMVGFPRYNNIERFDKEMARLLCEDVKAEWKGVLDKIVDAFGSYFCGTTTGGYVDMCGYRVDIKEFCAIRVDEFNINVKCN